MKTKLTKKSLCIVLVAVMMLGLSVINASACSHPTCYWEWEYDEWFDYYQLDDLKHDVCKSDVALCHLCNELNIYCTHWYSEPHAFTHFYIMETYLDYWEGVEVRVTIWEAFCGKCHDFVEFIEYE